MSRKDKNGRRLCTAHARSGELCNAPARKGQMVCRMHGGSSPQALAAAHRRIVAEVLEPATLKLVDLIMDDETPPHVRLAAIRTAWEFAGEKPAVEITLEKVAPVLDSLIAEAEAQGL